MANTGEFNFNITVGGNVFSGIAQIDGMMNNLTATIDTQRSFWNQLYTSAFKFNAILQSVKTIAGGVINTLNGFEAAYNIQNQAEIKLATVMRQRMRATDEQIESVKRLASAQQQLGIIGDEIQLSGVQQISTFLTQRDSIDALLPAMNNLLAQQKGINATEGDAVNVANLMGKVMQGQTSALTRVGITFSEAEEKVLKYGNESERAAMLAQVITNNVGDMNRQLAATPEGRLKQQANTMGDLKENVGRLYVNIKAALLPVFDVINVKLASLIEWFQSNMDTIGTVCSGIAGFLGEAFGVVWSILGGVVDVFVWLFGVINDGLPIIAGLAVVIGGWIVAANIATIKTWGLAFASKAMAVQQGIVAGVTKLWTGAQWLLNAALSANPIGIVIALVAGLVTAVVVCWNKFAGFRAFILTMWDTVKGFGSILKDFVIDRIKGIISGIGSLGSAIGKLFKGDFSGAWEATKTGLRQLSGIDSVKKAASSASELVGGVRGKFSENLASERAKDAAKKQEEEQQDAAIETDAAGGVVVTESETSSFAGTTGTGESPIGGAVSGIGGKAASEGSGKIKNINVTIDKVVESFTVTTNNLHEDASRIKNMISEVLVASVNDLNYAL